ncbi:MAG: DUF4038 domain-containing protein [Verrucomicrobia bacterium]|nr:DUF4038 domain-containing protein [Verrucomicrobiota bacterium]
MAGWTEVSRYIRQIDPEGHLLTLHTAGQLPSRACTSDPSVVDFEMLQTGHGMHEVIAPTGEQIDTALQSKPPVPVIDGEPAYENLDGKIPADVCRAVFWVCMARGAAGHSYGANGIWQVNNPGQPYGMSPLGHNWGTILWSDAMKLPGSAQVALGKKLLTQYEWWRFEPHAEWAVYAQPGNPFGPQAFGMPGGVRVIYVPKAAAISVRNLDPQAKYRALYFDPLTGAKTELGAVRADAAGAWTCPPPEKCEHDWVIVLEIEAY